MFKYIVFFCVIAAALAKPGLLSSSLGIAAGPAIVSAPSVGIIRTAPILSSIGAPLAISGGLVSNGLISGGLVSGGLLGGGLVSGKLISGGLVSGGLVSGGLIH